jgi:hypothetical protein
LGVQPHWLELLHVQVVLVPQSAAPVAAEQNFVQKNVVESPRFEHSPAEPLLSQSFKVAQNLPTPSSLPVSPGLPHVDANASTAGVAASGAEAACASGFGGVPVLLPLQPARAKANASASASLIELAR